MYEMIMTITFMVWVYVLILFALLAGTCAVIYIIYFVWDYKDRQAELDKRKDKQYDGD